MVGVFFVCRILRIQPAQCITCHLLLFSNSIRLPYHFPVCSCHDILRSCFCSFDLVALGGCLQHCLQGFAVEWLCLWSNDPKPLFTFGCFALLSQSHVACFVAPELAVHGPGIRARFLRAIRQYQCLAGKWFPGISTPVLNTPHFSPGPDLSRAHRSGRTHVAPFGHHPWAQGVGSGGCPAVTGRPRWRVAQGHLLWMARLRTAEPFGSVEATEATKLPKNWGDWVEGNSPRGKCHGGGVAQLQLLHSATGRFSIAGWALHGVSWLQLFVASCGWIGNPSWPCLCDGSSRRNTETLFGSQRLQRLLASLRNLTWKKESNLLSLDIIEKCCVPILVPILCIDLDFNTFILLRMRTQTSWNGWKLLGGVFTDAWNLVLQESSSLAPDAPTLGPQTRYWMHLPGHRDLTADHIREEQRPFCTHNKGPQLLVTEVKEILAKLAAEHKAGLPRRPLKLVEVGGWMVFFLVSDPFISLQSMEIDETKLIIEEASCINKTK